MTAFTNTRMSLVEVVKQTGADGNMIAIAEVLAKVNDVVADAQWYEANDIFSHKSVRRSSLPTGSWRKLNKGTAIEATDSVNMVDVIGLLEARSENDVKVIDAYPNPQQARSNEDMAFVEGLSQTMATAMIYANASTDPEKFTGLAPRMDALAATTNVIGAGGTGSDCTSIYVVTWGVNTVHMVYPRNSKAGLQTIDLGIVDALDSDSNKFRAYSTLFQWDAGLVVRHPKAIGRIANIESSGSTNIFDEDLLITLLNRMVTGPGTRIYCNQEVMTQIQIRAKDKANVNLSIGDAFGKPIYNFLGVPIRKVDAILNTDAAIS